MLSVEDLERAVLCTLFRRYPGAFVWIGGSVLHLVRSSPRVSYDLDLVPQDELLASDDLTSELQSALGTLSEAFHSQYALEVVETDRLRVTDRGNPIFWVDFTRITGRVAETTAVVLSSPLGPQAVCVPTDSSLLLLKLESLLFRRFLKPADVFDIWFLGSQGIRLEKHHRQQLSDALAMREITSADVESRLRKLTPERFLADLQRRVSAEEFHSWNPVRAKSTLESVRKLLRREMRWR